MTTCLLSLGSNLGDREATLRAVLAEIDALPDVQVARRSDWFRSQPVGGPEGQDEYLNAAAVIETTIPPLRLLDELKQLESRHGRYPAERWSARSIDIDILLYGTEVAETEMLTLPHPRMSFRPFVLEPAAQVGPKMLHPIIGWPVERLLLHLRSGSDKLAIVSPSEQARIRLGKVVQERESVIAISAPGFQTAEHHWPAAWTSWFAVKSTATPTSPDENKPTLPYAAAAFPKLTILLDGAFGKPADKLQWSTLVRQPGRGPTLRLQTPNPAEIDAEALAAKAAVWSI